MQHLLGGGHLPQYIHMDAALAIRPLVRDARLVDAAGDGVADQLVVPLTPGAAAIDLRDRLARRVEAVGVDAGKCANRARCCPGARALPVRYRNSLAALDEWQHLTPRNHQGDKLSHQTTPLRAPAKSWPPLPLLYRVYRKK